MENEDFENGEIGSSGDKSKPDEDDFETYEDYHLAMTEWKVDQKLAEKSARAAPPGQPPPQAPVSRHVQAAMHGTEKDKGRVPKIHEALETAQGFQADAARAKADGDEEAAERYEARALQWAKEFHDLAIPAYEVEKMHDEALDIAIHTRALEHSEEFSQDDLNIINAKSGSDLFMIKVEGKTHAISLPDGKTASGIFQEIQNCYRDTSPESQFEYFKRVGIAVPEIESEPQNQEAYEQGRKQPAHSSPFDGAVFKDAPPRK